MENIKKQRRGLSGSTLKIIAIVTMLIDHIGATIIEGLIYSLSGNWQAATTLYYVMLGMRIIGRLSFPIFCFLLVEGFSHTKNVRKYVLRLLIFALVSEVPFDFAFNQSFLEFSSQNVFFSLLIGVLMMWSMEYIKEHYKDNAVLLSLLSASAVLIASLSAYFIKCDYSSLGIFVILLMYILKDNKILKSIAVVSVFTIQETFNIQALAGLAMIPISLYNGKRGLSLKYFFYAFYPVHLLLLGIITTYII